MRLLCPISGPCRNILIKNVGTISEWALMRGTWDLSWRPERKHLGGVSSTNIDWKTINAVSQKKVSFRDPISVGKKCSGGQNRRIYWTCLNIKGLYWIVIWPWASRGRMARAAPWVSQLKAMNFALKPSKRHDWNNKLLISVITWLRFFAMSLSYDENTSNIFYDGDRWHSVTKYLASM